MDDAVPTNVNVFELVNLPALPVAALFLAITWFLARVVTGFFDQLGSRFSDRRLLFQQTATLVRFLIWLSGIAISTVTAVRLTEQVVLALTGTLAVAIGFAFKDLAASIVAGIIILIDRPFQVGDRVNFGGTYGDITSIGLRSVRLVTLDDNVVTIPNNKFLTEEVASGNFGALDMLVQMDFWIGTTQDIEVARQIVTDCVTSSRFVYTGKPWTVLIVQEKLEDNLCYRIRAKAYVLDVVYEKAFESDVHTRVALELRSAGLVPAL